MLYRGVTPDNFAKARAHYRQAFELDSQNVGALLGVGAVDTVVGALFMTADPASSLAKGEETLGKVLAWRQRAPPLTILWASCSARQTGFSGASRH